MNKGKTKVDWPPEWNARTTSNSSTNERAQSWFLMNLYQRGEHGGSSIPGSRNMERMLRSLAPSRGFEQALRKQHNAIMHMQTEKERLEEETERAFHALDETMDRFVALVPQIQPHHINLFSIGAYALENPQIMLLLNRAQLIRQVLRERYGGQEIETILQRAQTLVNDPTLSTLDYYTFIDRVDLSAFYRRSHSASAAAAAVAAARRQFTDTLRSREELCKQEVELHKNDATFIGELSRLFDSVPETEIRLHARLLNLLFGPG